jgi:hypothetical protein
MLKEMKKLTTLTPTEMHMRLKDLSKGRTMKSAPHGLLFAKGTLTAQVHKRLCDFAHVRLPADSALDCKTEPTVVLVL